MDYNEFKEAVLAEMQERFGDEAEVSIQTNKKNNGVIMDGLIIKKPDSAIVPIIYLEEAYDSYVRNIDVDIDEICDKLIHTYESAKPDASFDIAQHLDDYNWFKDRITANIINAEMNAERLNEIPNLPIKDLSVVFRVRVKSAELGEGSCLITNEHLKKWGVSINDIMAAASENQNTYMKPQVITMSNFLSSMLPGDMVAPDAKDMQEMYILTNESKYHGAAVLLNEGFIRSFTEKIDKPFVIIPSSIHEVIAVPMETIDILNLEAINEMVKDVNRTQLRDDDVLSDHVYVFDNKTMQLYTDKEYINEGIGLGGQSNIHTTTL